jgi:hypothetical protein
VEVAAAEAAMSPDGADTASADESVIYDEAPMRLADAPDPAV